MELSPKEIGGIIGWCLSLGGLATWGKINIKGNQNGLAELKQEIAPLVGTPKAVDELDKRLTTAESRFVTENNEPALLSYRAHKHICDGKNQVISQALQHVTKALDNNSEALKEHSEQVSVLTVAVAVLEEKVEREK